MAMAQIANGDFEIYSECPTGPGQSFLATGWSSPTSGTPDYFHVCGTGLGICGVPLNYIGNESAHSGYAYYGFFIRKSGTHPEWREYLQTQLISPLVIGTQYELRMYVSLADESKFTSSSFGALFSTEAISRNDNFRFTQTPQVINPTSNSITNKEGWTLITLLFIADSAYNYITIGNFLDADNTPLIYVGGSLQTSYLYIDDVSIASSDFYTSIVLPNIITPNGDGKNDLFIPLESKGITSMHTNIYNRWGSLVFESDKLSIEWDGTFKGNPIADGIYYWVIEYSDVNGSSNHKAGSVTLTR